MQCVCRLCNATCLKFLQRGATQSDVFVGFAMQCDAVQCVCRFCNAKRLQFLQFNLFAGFAMLRNSMRSRCFDCNALAGFAKQRACRFRQLCNALRACTFATFQCNAYLHFFATLQCNARLLFFFFPPTLQRNAGLPFFFCNFAWTSATLHRSSHLGWKRWIGSTVSRMWVKFPAKFRPMLLKPPLIPAAKLQVTETMRHPVVSTNCSFRSLFAQNWGVLCNLISLE